MKKGIILEINERFLTLLTPEGEFLRARKFDRQYQIGQEMEFFPIEQKEQSGPFISAVFQRFKGKTVFAAAILCMLAFISISPFYGNNDVYAYMSIDVNPSIELGVNEKFEVIEISSYNEDGQKIVEQIHNWKKKNIHVLTSEILQEMKEQGYIKDSRKILIATVYAEEKEKQNKHWEQEIIEVKNVIAKENLDLKVVEASKEERVKAKEEGLSTGIYKEKHTPSKKTEAPAIKEKVTKEKPTPVKKQAEKHKPSHNNTKIPTGQLKKEQVDQRKAPVIKKDKQIPPGQVKKKEEGKHVPTDWKQKKDQVKHTPPGQEKKKYKEKRTQPRDEKKQERSDQHNNHKPNHDNRKSNKDDK